MKLTCLGGWRAVEPPKSRTAAAVRCSGWLSVTPYLHDQKSNCFDPESVFWCRKRHSDFRLICSFEQRQRGFREFNNGELNQSAFCPAPIPIAVRDNQFGRPSRVESVQPK